MKPKSFRKFVEERDKETSSPHLDSLGDEMGIDPRDLEKEPQVGSFFSMGGETRNVGPYRVLRFKRNDEGEVTHAVVKRFGGPGIRNRRYKDYDGQMKRVETEDEDKTFIVPIEDIDKLMSQDFQPPPASPGGIM